MLQFAKDGDFKLSGAAADKFFKKLLFKTNIFIGLPAHERDTGVAHSLGGARQGSKRAVKSCEGGGRNNESRGHFYKPMLRTQ